MRADLLVEKRLLPLPAMCPSGTFRSNTTTFSCERCTLLQNTQGCKERTITLWLIGGVVGAMVVSVCTIILGESVPSSPQFRFRPQPRNREFSIHVMLEVMCNVVFPLLDVVTDVIFCVELLISARAIANLFGWVSLSLLIVTFLLLVSAAYRHCKLNGHVEKIVVAKCTNWMLCRPLKYMLRGGASNFDELIEDSHAPFWEFPST